ncbi:hypothetical protein GCM10009616_12990 [Microlunatus lacustris]
MDVTQLVITSVAVLGIVLVGAMAVIPAALDAWAAHDDPRPPVAAPTPRARHRRSRPVDLTA